MTAPHHNPTLVETDLRELADASLVIHSVQDRDELFDLATRVAAEMLDAEGCSILLRDLEAGGLVFHTVTGEKSSELKGKKSFRLAEGEGICGHCVRTRSSVIVNDVRSDPRFSPRADAESGFTTRSILCTPLIVNAECLGVLEVVNKRRVEGFDERDRIFCEAAASQIAVAIRNVQLTRATVETARLAAMGQAVAGVAHCMKNLLYGAQGGLYFLNKDLRKSNADVSRRGVEMVERNLGRLTDLVQEMLTYARERTPEYGEADLNDILRSVADVMRPRAQQEGRQLSVRCEVRPGTVEVDSAAIHRCVLNLVSNALDAGEENGGAVFVAGRAVGPGWVVIEVTDQGCGMDEHTRRCLFQPFFSTKGSKGTGLGLSVTHKIVQEHGGRIDVESEEAKGSTFRIYLPRRRPPISQ